MKFSVFVVTNWERKHLAATFLSYMKMYSGDNTIISVVENGTTKDKNLCKYLVEATQLDNFELIKLPKRKGLASVWNLCLSNAETAWVVLSNDDSFPTWTWEQSLTEHIEGFGDKIFLMCHPNGFSTFAIKKYVWEKYGKFNKEFPAGYYEDDDFYLKAAVKENLYRKNDMMQKVFFSFYDNYKKALFAHNPPRENLPKWNKLANKVVFDKYWVEVPSGMKHAIENKNGKFYIPKNGESDEKNV